VRVGDLVELRVKDWYDLSSNVGIVINADVGGWPMPMARRTPPLQRTVLVVWSSGETGPYWTDSLEVINESR